MLLESSSLHTGLNTIFFFRVTSSLERSSLSDSMIFLLNGLFRLRVIIYFSLESEKSLDPVVRSGKGTLA